MINRLLITVIPLVLFSALQVSAQSIKSIIHSDGSFDILGTTVEVTNAYPALDNKFLKPLNVKVTEKGNMKTVIYSLRKGMVELRFTYDGKALTINTKVTGLDFIPKMISILRDAEVTGAGKVYKTPGQIMGNGGIKDWPDNKAGNLSCSGITGLIADSGYTMTISTRDYKKYNAYTNAYTDRQGKKSIEVCLNTEKVSTTNIPEFYFTENISAFEAMKIEALEVAK
jgi:hypothetical protein